ncbi:Protein Skeletor, isoforms D/E [Folsomia candida]|uniref:Protein Skeletor, isoforms D/E n=1 Tax=Folsomia candida TaxID=158441 RepID=A0A226DTA3_FOLCA|nr:Protein Skeletor, isoforms D/E [Folsomia candida]
MSGPAAWFMVGKEKDGYTEERVELDGLIIPNEKGSCDILGAYDDENITLTIPKGMKFTDYSYLSVYCIENNHNFGYFRIKDEYAFTTPAPILLVNVTTGEITQQRDLSEDDAPENCDQENLVRRRRRDLGTPYRKYQLR